MKLHSKFLQKVLNKWPGKKLGVYRFLPLFFIIGAALEFTMINWKVGEVNFYETYKRRQAKEMAAQSLMLQHAYPDKISE